MEHGVSTGSASLGPKVGGLKVKKIGPCRRCPGQWIGETWVHSARCPATVVLWFPLGHAPADWTEPVYQCCPYHCPGQVLAQSVTHHPDCQFWAETDEVPFGLTPPAALRPEDIPMMIPPESDSAGLRLPKQGPVPAEVWEQQRAQAWKAVKGGDRWMDTHPKALGTDDDELPF